MKAKDFKDKFAEVMKDLLKQLTTKKEMEELGEETADTIRKRSRLGYGVSKQGGSKSKFKPLSAAYKKQRQRSRPTGPTSAAKSNITNTGAMLNDLQPISPKDGKVSIGFSDQEQEKKAEHVSEDRPFNNLSSQEIKRLKEQIEKKAQKEVQKALKKLK